MTYTFRLAYEENAFHQFSLIDADSLRTEADARDIGLPLSPLTELERLDREGAFSPIMFETVADDGEASAIFRDEQVFMPWGKYAVRSWHSDADEARPLYSRWQLLYLNDTIELPKALPIDWLLNDQERQTIDPAARDWWERSLGTWRSIEHVWRDTLQPERLAGAGLRRRSRCASKIHATHAVKSQVWRDRRPDDRSACSEKKHPPGTLISWRRSHRWGG